MRPHVQAHWQVSAMSGLTLYGLLSDIHATITHIGSWVNAFLYSLELLYVFHYIKKYPKDAYVTWTHKKALNVTEELVAGISRRLSLFWPLLELSLSPQPGSEVSRPCHASLCRPNSSASTVYLGAITQFGDVANAMTPGVSATPPKACRILIAVTQPSGCH
jgi:hypothetical protein